ncbi:AMP-binding protein [uncultured Umboniibacter sp.]|uniref:ApeI family dehydratase n=1 Tax=uncultured Umboniibacter sp. TaxID=1798917 RepID=UPI002604343F|nr:AMP-binding protein [uncultured Umboniibacter sp.]
MSLFLTRLRNFVGQRNDVAATSYHSIQGRVTSAEVGLFCERLDECCGALLGLLESGCTPILLNQVSESALGHFLASGRDAYVEGVFYESKSSSRLKETSGEIAFLTSGSSGDAKVVYKTLSQLEAEARILSQFYRGVKKVGGTVSHQHIYGFLFRLVVPVSLALELVPETWVYPSEVAHALNTDIDLAVISSPSQLARLSSTSAPTKSPRLVVSSGGPLSFAEALTAKEWFKTPILELYGSTETGGIATRSQSADQHQWKPLEGVSINFVSNEVSSPWCPVCQLDDNLSPSGMDGAFELSGRVDRIAKINEKRISLTAIEQKLLEYPAVKSIRVVPYSQSRLAAFIVVTDPQALTHSEVLELKNSLRRFCASFLEASTIPRKWRFLRSLPTTERSKVTDHSCLKLLSSDKRLPTPIAVDWLSAHELSLEVLISADLAWFEGHFPEQPVLPGVAMVWMAEQYIQLWFEESRSISVLATVKFQSVIKPGADVQIRLKYIVEKAQYHLKILNNDTVFAQAKLLVDE